VVVRAYWREGGYSPTRQGYEAWLDDGNVGSYQDFLKQCKAITSKDELIEIILDELQDMSVKELQEILREVRKIKPF